jgi:hypothetical protein
MTTKQSDLLATKPETKKALAVLQKFAEQEKAFKALEVAKKEAEATLLEAMVANDIVKLEGDWGYITKAVRKSYKGVDALLGLDLFAELDGYIEDNAITINDDGTTANEIDLDILRYGIENLQEKFKYLKLALDTTKVSAQVTLTGELPEGVTQSETAYITKKFK